MIRARRRLVEFARLIAQHVPQRYRHAIRYFGLLAPRTKNKSRAAVFSLLGQPMHATPPRLSWRESLIKYFGVDPLLDSCGEVMHWVSRESLARGEA
jgi:hypothetical protein